VWDDGIGIEPSKIGKIFDPFYTSKDVGKGMGLGLSITHHILERHRAVVDVTSEPGQWCRFRIQFPGRDEGSGRSEEQTAGSLDRAILQPSPTPNRSQP
jgi:signal transduction histidine kinase